MSECISCGYSMPSDEQFCTRCGMAGTVDPTNAATQHIDDAGAPSKDHLLDALRETTLGDYEILTELAERCLAQMEKAGKSGDLEVTARLRKEIHEEYATVQAALRSVVEE